MKALFNDGHVDEIPEDEELHVIRHSAAHIMAQAIERLYPGAKFAYGPATDNGFYYDVDLGDKKISEEDFPAIEDEMKKICKENLKFQVYEKPRDEAVAFMKERGQDYKVELQAHGRQWRLLEGRQGQQDAHPHQRRRLPQQGRDGRPLQAA